MWTKSDTPCPVSEHLTELRRRVMTSAASVLVATLVAFPFAPHVLKLITRPLYDVLPAGAKLIALSPFEAWSAYTQISVACGVAISSPVWIAQMISFFTPAIGRRLALRILAMLSVALVLFIAGVVFCFYTVLPVGLEWGYLLTESMGAVLTPQLGHYVSLVTMLLFAFGLAFELPFAVALLLRTGILPVSSISMVRPYAYVLSFVVGAVLTPPDVMSQVALSVPLVILFEIGVFFGKFQTKKRDHLSTVERS